MRKWMMMALLVTALAGFTSCAGEEPAPESEVFTLQVDGESVGEAMLPFDLSLIEQQVQAMTGGHAPRLFGVSMNVHSFGVETVGGSFSSASVGGFYSPAPVASGPYTVSGTCDAGGAVCNFLKTACVQMGPVFMDVAAAMGESTGGFTLADCNALDCNEISGLLDTVMAELPSDLRCAIAGILNCVTGQLPAIAGAVSGALSGNMSEAALLNSLTSLQGQLMSCVGPYAYAMESFIGDSAGGSATAATGSSNDYNYDDYNYDDYTY